MERISVLSKYSFLVCILAILVFSTLPKLQLGSYEIWKGFNLRVDYLLHFLAYLVLSASFLLWRKQNRFIPLITIFLFGAIFSLGLEFQQNFIAGRGYSLPDLYFNLLGLLVGSIISFIVKALDKAKDD